MKVKAKVMIDANSLETMALVCERSGIKSRVDVQAIEGFALTWQHPLSLWHNAKGFAKQPTSYLEGLNNNTLAGLFITIYDHFSLLEPYQLNGVELNSIIETASKESLIPLIQLSSFMTEKNTLGVGCLVVEWQDIKQDQTADKVLKQYYKRIKPYFIRQDNKEVQDNVARNARATLLAREGRALAGGTYISGKKTLSDMEKDFELKLKAHKKELKILADSSCFNNKQREILKALAVKRNLVDMDKAKRDGMIAKLEAMQTDAATQVAKILAETYNPYDAVVSVAEELERIGDLVEQEKPVFKSVAEMLAYRKSLKEAENQSTDSVADKAAAKQHSTASDAASDQDQYTVDQYTVDQDMDSVLEDQEDQEDFEDLIRGLD